MNPRRFVRLFKPQFAPLVQAGTKRQTIRPTPKRMPQSGDIIDCRAWTGAPYRTPQRRLIEAPILAAVPVTLTWSQVKLPTGPMPDVDAELLARDDGFIGLHAMLSWFDHEHGLPFTGVLIKWAPKEVNP